MLLPTLTLKSKCSLASFSSSTRFILQILLLWTVPGASDGSLASTFDRQQETINEERFLQSVGGAPETTNNDDTLSSYLGCFRDGLPRDLPLHFSRNISGVLECREGCGTLGYAYAALQEQVFCFCGNSYGVYGEQPQDGPEGDFCYAACADGGICGGNFHNSVYYSTVGSPDSNRSMNVTASPSSASTDSPTSSPSATPSTVSPTLQPSLEERLQDPSTSAPVFDRTQAPSNSPSTQTPTTGEPISIEKPETPPPSDVVEKSASPSPVPSNSPSSEAPSLALQRASVSGVMTMTTYLPAKKLDGDSLDVWQQMTALHVKKFLATNRAKLPNVLFDLSVEAIMVAQELPPPPPTADGNFDTNSDSDNGDPFGIQDTLIIDFQLAIRFRSLSTDYKFVDFVHQAWDEPAEREAYILALWLASETFRNVERVDVEIAGYTRSSNGGSSNGNGTGTNAGVDDKFKYMVVGTGAVVGCAALVIVTAFLYDNFVTDEEEAAAGKHKPGKQPAKKKKQKKTKKKKVGSAEDKNKKGKLGSVGPSKKKPQRHVVKVAATSIIVERQEDISTLGTPPQLANAEAIRMVGGQIERDETTASGGAAYDYIRQYNLRRKKPYKPFSFASNNTRESEILVVDDGSSFENQFADPERRFEVVVPAGKLGMVIDTPDGGPPVVHSTKEGSILSGRVQTGDRLLSVDGEDCTAMTAMQISKLISLRSEKRARVLAFCRALNIGVKETTIEENNHVDVDDDDDNKDDDDDHHHARYHRRVMTGFSESDDTGTIEEEVDVDDNDVEKQDDVHVDYDHNDDGMVFSKSLI